MMNVSNFISLALFDITQLIPLFPVEGVRSQLAYEEASNSHTEIGSKTPVSHSNTTRRRKGVVLIHKYSA